MIIEAAKNLTDEEHIQFAILGGGTRYEDFRSRIVAERIQNVFITGLQPQDRVSEVYSMGDVALITCKPGTGNAGMPSKTWSIMACNTPIIASFDLDSDLADIISESGAGCCVEPGNSMALADAIFGSYLDWKKGTVKRADLRAFALKSASKDECVKKYIDIIFEAAKTYN